MRAAVCARGIGPVLTNSLITSPCLVIDAPVPANYQQQSIMAPESANTVVLLRSGVPAFASHGYVYPTLPDTTLRHPSSSGLRILQRGTSVSGWERSSWDSRGNHGRFAAEPPPPFDPELACWRSIIIRRRILCIRGKYAYRGSRVWLNEFYVIHLLWKLRECVLFFCRLLGGLSKWTCFLSNRGVQWVYVGRDWSARGSIRVALGLGYWYSLLCLCYW